MEGITSVGKGLKTWEEGVEEYLRKSGRRKKKDSKEALAAKDNYALGMQMHTAKPELRMKLWRADRKAEIEQALFREAYIRKMKEREESQRALKAKQKGTTLKLKIPTKGKGKRKLQELAADREEEEEEDDDDDEAEAEFNDAGEYPQEDDEAFEPGYDDHAEDDYEDGDEDYGASRKSRSKSSSRRGSKRQKTAAYSNEDDEVGSGSDEYIVDAEMEARSPGWRKKLSSMSKRQRALTWCKGAVDLWGGSERMTAETQKSKASEAKKL
eukprot:scaffold7471_cov258-Pinguiococcus_pyrenoidosus.AAC.1